MLHQLPEVISLIEGQTDAEVCSLAKSVWQAICFFSLRQRRALLLNSQELIFDIRQSGISDEELARMFWKSRKASGLL